jgi:PHAX RNA-binding domain
MIDTSTPIIDEQSERTALSRSIADQLHETQDAPIYTIRLSLKLPGSERILALVEETLQVESNGGMKTQKGQRRTVGGTFFKLLKAACTKEQYEQLFPPDEKRPYVKRAAKKQA